MLTIVAFFTICGGTDLLPNETTALEKLQAIWRASTGGVGWAQPTVDYRWTSENRAAGELTFLNSDKVSYRFSDTRIYSAHFAREKDTAHMPVLHESILRERSLDVVALLVPGRFTFRADSHGFTEDRSEFVLSWSYMCDGFPTHLGPTVVRIDARTSKPIRLHAPLFDWSTDPTATPRFTEEHCYQVAWARYLGVKPIAVAPEARYGARWVSPKIEQDPSALARSTAPYAYWASDKYRAHLAEQRAVLAYSFWFGWQCVLVDAITGEPMMVWGVNINGSGRSGGAQPGADPVVGKTWQLVKKPMVTGSLKATTLKAERNVATKSIALRSENLTLVGQYDSASKLLWVDHPTGAKSYEVTGELARALAKADQ